MQIRYVFVNELNNLWMWILHTNLLEVLFLKYVLNNKVSRTMDSFVSKTDFMIILAWEIFKIGNLTKYFHMFSFVQYLNPWGRLYDIFARVES